MKKEKFHELLTKPESMKNSDTAQLQQVIKDYPFFHNAHLLLLFGLSRQNSESFDEQLKQSALYLSSRAQLVHSIVNGWPGSYVNGTESENVPVNVELTEEKPNVIVFDSTDSTAPVVSESSSKGEEFVSSISASNEVTFEESFTFSLEDSKPIETLDKKEEAPVEKTETTSDLLEFDISSSAADEVSEDLIDQFLKVNPRIVPRLDLEDVRGDMSVPGLIENDEIVTETLAEIYEQQGHYQKSKEAYQKLILKFPEKKAYFASRIEELDKLIK